MENIRALLIDDEEELVTTLVERFASRGVQAEYSTTGRQALEMLASKPYDVVLLDVILPDTSGLELMKIIKSAHPEVKILLVTGKGGIAEELARSPESQPPQADGLLFKPVNIDVLLGKLKSLVGR